jgi:hypothetical protein
VCGELIGGMGEVGAATPQRRARAGVALVAKPSCKWCAMVRRSQSSCSRARVCSRSSIVGSDCLGVRRVVVRVGLDNTASRALFRSVGFVHESTSEVFSEETLVCDSVPAALASLPTEHMPAHPADLVAEADQDAVPVQ